MSAADRRSPEARRRRAPARARAIASGSRISCDECKTLHVPPACPVGSEPVPMQIHVPAWLHPRIKDHVVTGERSAWVVRLIRRDMGL